MIVPSKPYNPARPTIYLDQSTLSDAFRAKSAGNGPPVDAAYGPLVVWIERVANEANLCISFVHLIGLSRWVT